MSKRHCDNPHLAPHFIEEDRGKSAKYCRQCSQHRSTYWKKDHPERVKLYGDGLPPKIQRVKEIWNAYMRWYRATHPEYREKSKSYVHDHRQKTNRAQEREAVENDPVKTGVLLFLTLFFIQFDIALFLGGVWMSPGNSKAGMMLFAACGMALRMTHGIIMRLIQ
jgi:hypothetical protein